MPIIRFSNFHKYIYLFVLIGKKHIRAQLHYRKKCCARWSIIICISPTVEYNVENQYNILHAVRSARVKVPEAWKEIHWLLNGVMNHVKEKRSDEKKEGGKNTFTTLKRFLIWKTAWLRTRLALHTSGSLTTAAWARVLSKWGWFERGRKRSVCTSVFFWCLVVLQ